MLTRHTDPLDLVTLSLTCKHLLPFCQNDLCWQSHVQYNVPELQVSSPYPCKTFKELYVSHDPHWFLPKYKIWFSDFWLTGKIMIVRYNLRQGHIEGYRLVAERAAPTFETWEADEEVLIHSFEPKVRLHLDQPILKLDGAAQRQSNHPAGKETQTSRFNKEVMMPTSDNRPGIRSTFLLTRPVEEHSSMSMWPPKIIPSRHRVVNLSQEGFIDDAHRPHQRSEISDLAFRIRRWMQVGDGIHLGEEVHTYATLDPKLYTPTEEKPWRGIWVGDYSGHGCEFLLMHQPDDKLPFDDSELVQGKDETAAEFLTRKKESRIYRGSMSAIKLTGDPNIQRGEDTFRVEDLSRTIRVAYENIFKGARIVESEGHVAGRMFRDDQYIESQIILLSHDRIAQHWVAFGHISYYERVDINSFVSAREMN
ncbi:hypothetical protein BJ878DRAFT_535085 [Calycina marina]|uniref:F-box domain-containing protein n=1 Tax=Calycina marina TaxID=1763456 RepID=A0A9P7Z1G4_9HELO|nr:hypothetical protein BJ878DRAFT_535085 [Calycina marina]